MEQPVTFRHVDTIAHQGSVVAFGEEWIEDNQDSNAGLLDDDPVTRRLWYRVLDLEQTADQDQTGAWEDATRWTRWYEVSWPQQLRPVGLSLLTVDCTAEHNFATVAGRWKVITDGTHIYLFRSLNLQNALDRKRGTDNGATRVYANRYTLVRAPSPDSGTNKAAKGQEVTVPQLRLAREARYRRSAMRESPLGDTDSQGTRDLGNLAFIEPTMEWSMLRPIDGAFTVTLTPSNVPGRMRWQFFCRWERPSGIESAPLEPAVAAFSMLRDEDGWADLEEAFDRLNTPADRFRILPDAVFRLRHDRYGPLQLLGRPDALTFRLQEQGGATDDGEVGAISPQRVLLAARVKRLGDELGSQGRPTSDSEAPSVAVPSEWLAVLDFGLGRTGVVEVGGELTLSDVNFARTALWLNSNADRVELLAAGRQVQRAQAFSAHAWVRHDEGTGTLLCRGWDAGEDPVAAAKTGWAIEWRADSREVVGVRVLELSDGEGMTTLERFEVRTPVPVSHTWHHIALVQDADAKLALYVDGALANESTIVGEPTSYEINAAITVGGPVDGGPVGSWLDFRIDQVVVWQRAVVPSLATIYVELDDAAREEEELVGYWTFDRGASNDVDIDNDAGYAASYRNDGANVVSQTAPLFPPEKAEFEKHLGAMSADMGLLRVPGWQVQSDPRLFVGADGIVRLYAIARQQNSSEDVAGGLVYDTTTTRAHFTFDWKAVDGRSKEQAGALILQARKAGPVMNRAALTLEETDDKLTLTVVHPHRDDLAETWRNLPRELEDFIAVINGRASAEPDDEAVRAGDLPYYAYATDGPQAKRDGRYPSELVQAVPLSVPDNGAQAMLQPGIAALRQQGNFTGWTRAPLMVSGHFGNAGHGQAVANIDLTNDRMDRLRIPGDFAIEAWVQPQGGRGLQRVVNWLQGENVQGENDGVSLVVENERRIRLSADSVPSIELFRTSVSTKNVSWFSDSDKPGVTIKARFQLPVGGGEGGVTSLVTLVSETQSSLDLKTMFEEIGNLSDQDSADWNANAAEFSNLTSYAIIHVQVQLRLSIHGRRARFDVISKVTPAVKLPAGAADEVVWTNPYTDEGLTPGQTKAYVENTLVPLWQDLAEGKTVSPSGEQWSVSSPKHQGLMIGGKRPEGLINVPLGSDEGDDVEVAIVVQPNKAVGLFADSFQPDKAVDLSADSSPLWANSGKVSCYIDGRLASVFVSDDQAALKDGWLAPVQTPSQVRVVVGQVVEDKDSPFAGIVSTVEVAKDSPFAGIVSTVEVWSKTSFTEIPDTEIPELFNSFDPILAIDFRPTSREQGDEVVVTAAATPTTSKEIRVPSNAYFGAFRIKPTLGDRRYSTGSSFAAADWLHLGLVCADNFAVRFERDGDRAVIKDADGLNPDRAFTIACVVVREHEDTRRDVFSKATELGEDRLVTFRLSIDGDGFPWLKYTLEIEGERKVRELKGHDPLAVGRPYRLCAKVSIEDVFWPSNPDTGEGGRQEGPPAPRWQIWFVREHIWLFDIGSATWVRGQEPSDHRAEDIAAGFSLILLKQLLLTALTGATTGATLANFQPNYDRLGILRSNRDSEPFFDLKVKASSVPAAIGAATGEDATQVSSGQMAWFRGLIGSVQFWRTALPAAAIRRLVRESGLPSGVDSPAAWWRFDENKGLQARDSTGGMTATLTREQMWVNSRTTAQLTLFVDGRPVPLQPDTQGPTVTYGAADRFTVGGRIDAEGQASETFSGRIDEVRVWRDVRTNEEILDNMHVRLGGNEDDLAGYWPINAGVGGRIKDTSGGGNHAILNLLGQAALQAFWQRVAAPVGDDLPQVRHLLGGLGNSWIATALSTSPIAAEYGDLQSGPDGRLRGVQKRALVFGRKTGEDVETGQERGWANLTGFKIGDLDFIYIGQAQSDPTLIGYIEGAPPVPTENLTRAYWTSSSRYNAYSYNTDITLEEADNTSIVFNAEYDHGLDLSVESEQLFGFSWGATVGSGVAFGGFADFELKAAKYEVNVGPKETFKHSQNWMRKFGMTIGTTRTLSNTLGLGGSWEPADSLLNRDVGRRYLPDNVGYALVKSGVANIYVLRLRKNGALFGLRMVPDPDIPEDLNILSFQIRATYTKQGTLDGMVGFVPDLQWPDAMQTRGSYFQPREVANLEAEIESYEAKLLATYDQFDADAFGRRSKGIHFQEDDPAASPKQVVEDNIEVPYDWDKNLSKRNIVNTYVWTSTGGFLAEEVRTSIVRTESNGGSYNFKGMAGVKFGGLMRTVVGFTWDLEALFGGHIETTVVKTKQEGQEFGLAVNVECDDLLERYVGKPDQLYNGTAAPGKVQGYRFKSFYLVPDKQHFEHFWSSVVDEDWLRSDNADARALRQARANVNHTWRVFHRVTYVNRVPPTGNEPLPLPVKTTRAVIHRGANWQNIKLVLDVLREGVTSTGESIDGLGNPYEKIAMAVDDLLHNQWAPNAPWWKAVVDAATTDPDGDQAETLRELRRATFDYMRAYYDTGLLTADPRLTQPPRGRLPWGQRVSSDLVVLYRFTAAAGDVVADVSGFGAPLDLMVDEPEHVSWLDNGGLAVKDKVLIASTGPASKIVEACQASDEITIEAWIRPAKARQKGPARIVTLSKDSRLRNFTLGQGYRTNHVSGHFDARLRTSDPDIDDNGRPSTTSNADRATTQITHLAFTRTADGEAALYVDGERIESGRIEGTFDNWDPAFRLALANELSGDRPWLGEYHLIAIYSRALSEAEIGHNFSLDSQRWR